MLELVVGQKPPTSYRTFGGVSGILRHLARIVDTLQYPRTLVRLLLSCYLALWHSHVARILGKRGLCENEQQNIVPQAFKKN